MEKQIQPALDDFESQAMPHINDLYRTACRVIGNASEAEDIVQETYLQAWKSFHRFEPGTNIRAWMFKIMFHVTAHHRRKLFKFKFSDFEQERIAETVACDPAPPADLRDEEVIEALAKVPLNYRSVILLADIQEFTYREISQILHIPIGTVMSRLNRGRKILREALETTTAAADFLGIRRFAVGQ